MTAHAASPLGAWTARLVCALAACATLAVLLPAPGVVRAAAALSFALVAPGAAIAGLLGIRGMAAWATVTLAGSLTVGVIGTELAALAGWWQPRVMLVGLAAACVAASLLARRLEQQRVGAGGLA